MSPVSQCQAEGSKNKLTLSNNEIANRRRASSPQSKTTRTVASFKRSMSRWHRAVKNSSVKCLSLAFVLEKLSNNRMEIKGSAPGRPVRCEHIRLLVHFCTDFIQDRTHPRVCVGPNDTNYEPLNVANDFLQELEEGRHSVL